MAVMHNANKELPEALNSEIKVSLFLGSSLYIKDLVMFRTQWDCASV